MKLVYEVALKNVCIVKGGIDAIKLEDENCIRQAPAETTFKQTLKAFENFITKTKKGQKN